MNAASGDNFMRKTNEEIEVEIERLKAELAIRRAEKLKYQHDRACDQAYYDSIKDKDPHNRTCYQAALLDFLHQCKSRGISIDAHFKV